MNLLMFLTDHDDCQDDSIPVRVHPALSDEYDMQEYQSHAIGDRWFDRRMKWDEW